MHRQRGRDSAYRHVCPFHEILAQRAMNVGIDETWGDDQPGCVGSLHSVQRGVGSENVGDHRAPCNKGRGLEASPDEHPSPDVGARS